MLPLIHLPGSTQLGVSVIAFSVDGKLLASGSGDAVRVWDLDGRNTSERAIIMKPIRQLIGDFALSFSADGKSLWGANGSEVYVWTIAKGAAKERAPA